MSTEDTRSIDWGARMRAWEQQEIEELRDDVDALRLELAALKAYVFSGTRAPLQGTVYPADDYIEPSAGDIIRR